MTGLPNFNRPAFHAAAAELRAAGYEVVNPAELDESEPITNPDGPGAWERYMRRDIPHLCKCDALALLPGWEQSKGARLERSIATALTMAVWPPLTWVMFAKVAAQRTARDAAIEQAKAITA
jgi:hypothetical protein